MQTLTIRSTGLPHQVSPPHLNPDKAELVVEIVPVMRARVPEFLPNQLRTLYKARVLSDLVDDVRRQLAVVLHVGEHDTWWQKTAYDSREDAIVVILTDKRETQTELCLCFKESG